MNAPVPSHVVPAYEKRPVPAALLVLGDRVTTDHISPAGSIAEQGLAGQYLRSHPLH